MADRIPRTSETKIFEENSLEMLEGKISRYYMSAARRMYIIKTQTEFSKQEDKFYAVCTVLADAFNQAERELARQMG